MRFRTGLISAALLLCSLTVVAKNKKKGILPTDVLEAHTAWVVVDPQAGVDVTQPTTNNNARAAVEYALTKWGRLSPVSDPRLADLVIVVRKGNRRPVEPTIGGTPINAPPPMIGQQTDTDVNAAGRSGPPYASQNSQPHPQLEVGPTDDMFTVYRGKIGDSPVTNVGSVIDTSPVWRYAAEGALDAPGVPAVEAFRKAIADSEKQLAKP
jgi:hypothetical protein